jgi:hypothetical protein
MSNEYGQQPYPGQQPPVPGYGQQPGYPQTPPGGQPVYAGQPYPQGQGQNHGGGYGQQAPLEKPGTITGAAVLGFIQAGITLIATIILAMGLMNAGSVTDGLAEPWVVTIAQFVGVILLIFGSVQLIGGSNRNLYLIAVGLEIVISLYWAIRFGAADTAGLAAIENFRNSLILIAVGFVIMPVIGLILAAGSGTGRYIAAKRGR